MRKDFTFSLLAVSLLAGSSATAAVVQIDGRALGMSPDGTLVVGNKSAYDEARFSSFVFNASDGSLQWLTDGVEYFKDHLDGGWFRAVNNAGVIAGTVRNPEMRLESSGEGGGFFAPPATRNFSDDDSGQAICSAAVWRDGKVSVLGVGSRTMASFQDADDGSVAIGISADGNTVFGYIVESWYISESCVWQRDEAGGEYSYRSLPVPEGCTVAQITAVSEAGFPAVGNTSLRLPSGDKYTCPVVWLSPTEVRRIAIPNEEAYYYTVPGPISADGTKIVVTASLPAPYMAVYDIPSATFTPVTLSSSTFDVTAKGVDNSGNVIFSVTNDDKSSAINYFDMASGSVVPLSTYFSDVLPEGEALAVSADTEVVAMSGDGKTILLRLSSVSNSSVLVQIENPGLASAPAPDDVRIYHTSPMTVEVSFPAVLNAPVGCEITGYDVYVDGINAGTIAFDTANVGEFTLEAPGKVGTTHTAYVVTRFNRHGEEAVSGQSPTVTCYVSSDLTLYDNYDFDDSSLDEQGNINWNRDVWQTVMDSSNPSEMIYWHLAAEDMENRTPFLVMYAMGTTPWSCVYLSHFMDASEAEDILLDLRCQMRLVNSANQNLSTDWLEVEASTDGRNWKSVGAVCAADLTPGLWTNIRADLSKELAGEVFQLRLRAHGEGKGMVRWAVDDITVTDGLHGDAPAAMRYDIVNGNVRLQWLNSMGLYELSCLPNTGLLYDLPVGNYGEPCLSAIEFAPERTAPFAGSYISDVSTFLYDNPAVPQLEPTKAEAIIYADGKEVARADFSGDMCTVEQVTAHFAHPVRIEPGVTYRAAVRIYDYAEEQTPMYYIKDPDCIAGVTDLYSEDEGATWQHASRLVVNDLNPEGYCTWPIRMHISAMTDEAIADKPSDDLMYYNLYRNGERVNAGCIFEPHPWFELSPADANGTYAVQAYYRGGLISPLSEPVTVDLTGVAEVKFSLGVSVSGGTVTVNGDCCGATLIDLGGRIVAQTSGSTISGIPAGIYLLEARTAEGVETYKIIVK